MISDKILYEVKILNRITYYDRKDRNIKLRTQYKNSMLLTYFHNINHIYNLEIEMLLLHSTTIKLNQLYNLINLIWRVNKCIQKFEIKDIIAYNNCELYILLAMLTNKMPFSVSYMREIKILIANQFFKSYIQYNKQNQQFALINGLGNRKDEIEKIVNEAINRYQMWQQQIQPNQQVVQSNQQEQSKPRIIRLLILGVISIIIIGVVYVNNVTFKKNR